LRSLILFGAHGQLGSAIARAFPAGDSTQFVAMPWEIAGHWQAAQITAWLGQQPRLDETDIVFANGLTDPSLGRVALTQSNTDFPLRIIEAGSRFPGLRFMTIGTVMEARSSISNGYVASKLALSRQVAALALGPLQGRLLHLRLHTLYGVGEPHPHLFLGQMLSALRANRPFSMSSGRQYRQYHHTDDVAVAVLAILRANWQHLPLLQLNSTETLQLGQIAEEVFGHFGKLPLLKMGALTEQATDVWEDPHYVPTDPAYFPAARPALPNIVTWLADWMTP